MANSKSQEILIQMTGNAYNHPHLFGNAGFDFVVMVASVGGLTALAQVLSTLPKEFTDAIALIVL